MIAAILLCLIPEAGPTCHDVAAPVSLDTSVAVVLIDGERRHYYTAVVLGGPCGERRVFAYQHDNQDDVTFRDGSEDTSIVNVECGETP